MMIDEKSREKTELELEETNMYVLFAKMFACIAREVEKDFGVTFAVWIK